MEQVIRELSDSMIKRIESQRDWVRNHYSPDSIDKYETIAGKLSLLDIILKSNWIQKDETNKLQCLGITLGDIVIQDLGFRWIEIEDDYGIDPAIKLDNTSIILFPLTMISKRIEKGEKVNIFDLYNLIKSNVDDLKIKNKRVLTSYKFYWGESANFKGITSIQVRWILKDKCFGIPNKTYTYR